MNNTIQYNIKQRPSDIISEELNALAEKEIFASQIVFIKTC